MDKNKEIQFYHLKKSFFDKQVDLLHPKKSIKNYTDYSKYKIQKPWGYEYLLYGNSFLSIWILYLNKHSQTSMHSHKYKITHLIPLKNVIHLNTLDKKFFANKNTFFTIDKGVFHQSFNKENNSNLLMEIEVPNLKNDIIRYHDEYGRDSNDFEVENKLNSKILNKNYIKKFNKRIKIEKNFFLFTKIEDKEYNLDKFSFFLVLNGKLKIKNKVKKIGYFGLTKDFNNQFSYFDQNTFVVFF